MKTIKKSTLDFLTALKCNNDRDWFTGNRQVYLYAKDNFESFAREIINEIALFDPLMKGLEVKDCVFRINRDIRFSNDKSPYKTNFGAFIVRGGKKTEINLPVITFILSRVKALLQVGLIPLLLHGCLQSERR